MDTCLSDRIVGHYGVFEVAGLKYLHQQGGGRNPATSVASPLTVVPPKKTLTCPHGIDLSTPRPDAADRFHASNLVSAFLPIPNKRILYVDGNPPIPSLVAFSSPLRKIAFPIWGTRLKALSEELNITNCAPLIVYGLSVAKTDAIFTLAEEARMGVRTLVMIGDADAVTPNFVERHTWDHERDNWPGVARELGAWALKEWMLGNG